MSDSPDPHNEARLLDAGYTAREAAFINTMLQHAELAGSPQDPPDDLNAWLAARLEPHWVCRLLANHVTRVAVGVALYERAMNDSALQGVLDRRADALGANNRDLHISPQALEYRQWRRPFEQ